VFSADCDPAGIHIGWHEQHCVDRRHFADRDYVRYQPPRNQFTQIINNTTNIPAAQAILTDFTLPTIDTTATTFAPDAAWCRILEYYCPGCGTQIEAEYLPPGHPPVYDMQIDVDALKAQWAERPAGTVIPLGRDVTAEPLRVDGGSNQ
jgi:hypothetical protein